MKPETVIWAIPAGETERWHEDVISSHCRTAADVAAVKAAAAADGWHSFRVATINFDRAPDFAGTINKGQS